MELIRVDTKRAYELIREKIITLELEPGQPLDEGKLAQELEIGQNPVREALRLLVHDHLVKAPPRGLYVSSINIDDLEKISAIRIQMETLAARQAAQKASEDDLIVLNALCQEDVQEVHQLLDLDHKFHQAIAQAAHNKYLADVLEHFFGLSQRMWYLVLPKLEFLPGAVKSHIELTDAIKSQDADRAGELMHAHIEGFYRKISKILMSNE
ncbi:MAG: HTH-type transcriptional repressor RspR [Chloroflexi bacterium]|nr:HTH-type transcriptional repressor RspR [Chloroflexota bacterium]